MKLDNITFTNYRCFPDFTINFAEKVNVLIGRNGAGKTSAVKGIVKSLSFMFSNDKSLGSDFISAGLSTLNVRTITDNEFLYVANSRNYSTDSAISATASLPDDTEPLDWSLYRGSTSGSALYPSRYRTAFLRIAQRAQNNSELPLLAFFSDSFPHHLS